MKTLHLLPIALLLAACTATHYESPGFGALTIEHREVAVLPFEMRFAGKAPRNLTAEDVYRIEEAESLAFQRGLYYRLLNRSSAHRRRPILIDLQPPETTNRLLDEHGIGLRQSWTMSPAVLADVLGVDAVLRTSVLKTRYLSAPASLGRSVGLEILYESTDGAAGLLLPPDLAKTHDIAIDSALLSGDDGKLLWQVGVDVATDWSRPANDVIDYVTRRLAKKFPYRRRG